MNFLRNNPELLVAYGVLIAMLVMAVAFGPAVRMGHESAFAHHSVHEVLAGIVRGK